MSEGIISVSYSTGTEIMGPDREADFYYLVGEGQVEVEPLGEDFGIASQIVEGRDDCGGQMTLLTCSPRNCRVTAKTDVTLLALPRAAFYDAVSLDAFRDLPGGTADDSEPRERLLHPFSRLAPEALQKLSGELWERRYGPGDDIVRQGDEGSEYFVIRSGRARVLREDEGGAVQEVAMIGPGDGFGEEALVTGLRRNATIRADSDLLAWALGRAGFDRIMASSFVREVFPEDLAEIPAELPPAFIDIRQKPEYAEEHIPGALNIPLRELRRRYAELDFDREYFVYCVTGVRSRSAVFLLNSNGFRASSVTGGLSAWPGDLISAGPGVHTPAKPT